MLQAFQTTYNDNDVFFLRKNLSIYKLRRVLLGKTSKGTITRVMPTQLYLDGPSPCPENNAMKYAGPSEIILVASEATFNSELLSYRDGMEKMCSIKFLRIDANTMIPLAEWAQYGLGDLAEYFCRLENHLTGCNHFADLRPALDPGQVFFSIKKIHLLLIYI